MIIIQFKYKYFSSYFLSVRIEYKIPLPFTFTFTFHVKASLGIEYKTNDIQESLKLREIKGSLKNYWNSARSLFQLTYFLKTASALKKRILNFCNLFHLWSLFFLENWHCCPLICGLNSIIILYFDISAASICSLRKHFIFCKLSCFHHMFLLFRTISCKLFVTGCDTGLYVCFGSLFQILA